MYPRKKRRLDTLYPSKNDCKKGYKATKEPNKNDRVCVHIWKEDDIDFMSGWTEKSMSIVYCIECYETKK